MKQALRDLLKTYSEILFSKENNGEFFPDENTNLSQVKATASETNNSTHLDKDRPILTTAGVVHICPENKIALIKRGKEPHGLAMFGGHIEAKESPEQAFKRELEEELNITRISNFKLIGVHGDYGRDPRQHSVEVTYSCSTNQMPAAGSDAKSVKLYTTDRLQSKLERQRSKFAFDHGQILKNYLDSIEGCNICNER